MKRAGLGYGAFPDSPLAELAAAQHGVVAVRQLHDLGHTRAAIGRRRDRGRLFRIHRGVYAVGHPRMTQRGRWMAAVLACGEPAALSHHQAAALHNLRRAPYAPIHVVAPSSRSVAGIACHAARGMRDRPPAVVDGIRSHPSSAPFWTWRRCCARPSCARCWRPHSAGAGMTTRG